jgi:hypothetical protein
MRRKIIFSIFLGLPLILTAQTNIQAAPSYIPQPMSLAQRHCPEVDFSHALTMSTTCTWSKKNKDSVVSLTTHINDTTIDRVDADCSFIPAANSTDSLKSITGAKAASISNLSINDNNAKFSITRKGKDKNVNILFHLNKDDASYADGDQVKCDFTVVRK